MTLYIDLYEMDSTMRVFVPLSQFVALPVQRFGCFFTTVVFSDAPL